MTNDYEYETRIGRWVTDRCTKRAQCTGKEMPQEVREWLDEGGNSAAGPNTRATPRVLGWLVMTIDEPHWPEP